jgi:hypothetical protein
LFPKNGKIFFGKIHLSMKNPIVLLLCAALFFLLHSPANAQVKIGNNPNTIDANSLLELESTNKGFLPPRMALNDATLVAPLTGTVPTGMLVFSSGGTLPDGYYYWNGSAWKLIATSEVNLVTKTASATLTKNETFVLASNDIIITLPSVSAADNGLAITVKNIGTYTDLVVVKGGSGVTVDGKDSSKLTRWFGRTYIAYNGNWIKKEQVEAADNLLDVSAEGSWTTIGEAIEFLDEHMSGPSVIRLSGGSFEIDATQVIDLDYPLTIQGLSYSKATIEAATGLSGPMFRCISETYFKMLAFDATTLAGYSNTSGNDAIQLEGAGEYFEIKDCSFTGFNKTIVLESNVELWLFEVDINDAETAGVEIAAGATNGVSLKTSETDFINCEKGINLLSGSEAIISVLNCGFYNTAGQVGVNYVPATFTDFTSMFITNNSWNNLGSFFSGFDFTRSDGRDADTFIQNNAGDGDKNPTCRINVTNNSSTTTITTNGTWYKANWTNTSSITTKWTIDNNKIIYQPQNRRDAFAIITGSLSINSSNKTVSIGLVKNGNSATRIGETDLRVTTANQPFQFSTVVYLSDIGPNDYFELYCTSSASNDVITFQDIQWFTETK